MSSPTDLPPNVRRLVDEIESEIGETSIAIDDITGSRGRDRGPPPGHLHEEDGAAGRIIGRRGPG